MPKKKDKKNSDKQDKDLKTPKKDSPATEAEKNVCDDNNKHLYLTQIRYLNEQSERYQLRCDQLERQMKDLNSQFSVLEKEKRDIVEYLKHSLLEKEDEVEELTDRLGSQGQAADKDRDILQLQHSQLRQELQDQIEELIAKNETLVEKLASLEEFQKLKEQLKSNMESLENQLARQKEEHKAAIHSLEMKALMERKRLEQEMEGKVATMAAEVQDLVTQKVSKTTKLAIEENAEVKAQFSQLSEEALVLMGENSTLRDHKSQLSVDVDILEQMLSEMSRQSCIRKKAVEQLTEKYQQLQVELKDCRQELEQLQTKHTGVLTEVETLRQGRATLSEQCSHNTAEVSRLKAELQEERKRRSRMKTVMQEAARTLRQALMETPTDQDSAEDSVLQWKQLMEMLLVVLDQPTPTNSTAKNHQPNGLQSSDPAASRTGPGPAPRPTMKLKHSRMGAGSSSNHLPLYRKPSCQKIAGSINTADRFLTSRDLTKTK